MLSSFLTLFRVELTDTAKSQSMIQAEALIHYSVKRDAQLTG